MAEAVPWTSMTAGFLRMLDVSAEKGAFKLLDNVHHAGERPISGPEYYSGP